MSFNGFLPRAASVRPGARRACAAGLVAVLFSAPLSGCASGAKSASSSGAASVSASASELPATSSSVEHLLSASDLVSEHDLDPSYEGGSAVHVELSDSGTTADGDGVSVDGNVVTISAGGTYVLSGELADGQVVVDADGEKVQLVLAGASVSSADSAAVYVKAAKKVFLTLADGTQNSLTTTGEYAASDEANVDGAVWAKSDLTVNGAGSLSVSSASGHGIVCKDDLVMVSGSVNVEAAGHAIQAKDSATLTGGEWALTAGTDGIHCGTDEDTSGEKGSVLIAGGSVSIAAGSDGVDAAGVLEVDGGDVDVSAGDDGLHADYALQVDGGSIEVSKSYEGLEGSTVTINAGEVDVTSSDDGINAAGEPGSSADGSASGSGSDGSAEPGGAPQAPGDAGEPPQQGGAQPGAGQPGDGQPGDGQPAGGMDENDPTASLVINGGVIRIEAQGDGVDSNGDLTVTDGELYVSGPNSGGDGMLDFAGTGTVTGGVVMCAGTSSMLQTFSVDGSSQGTIAVSASGNAGDLIQLLDAGGNVLASFSTTTSYECILVSAPAVQVGATLTLSHAGETQELTLDSLVYTDVASTGSALRQDPAAAPGGGAPGDGAPLGGGEAPSGSPASA